MVLPKNSENTIEWIYAQRGSIKENGNEKDIVDGIKKYLEFWR